MGNLVADAMLDRVKDQGVQIAIANSGEGRIVDVMVGGEPIDPAKTYLLVSNNYVRGGGDGYKMFRDAANAYDFGPDLADVLAEYMAANGPVAPMLDGRITKK